MGKPFSQELDQIVETYNWANNQDTKSLEQLTDDRETPVLVVGSGGSFSACYHTVHLLQQLGIVAKAITPLELHNSKKTLRKSRILFISASGKNSDILFAFKTAIEENPVSIVTFCMRLDSPLTILAKKYSTTTTTEYIIPAGKDGFLATNSLVAYFTILSKALQKDPIGFIKPVTETELSEIKKFVDSLDENSTTTVLYSGWGQPTAIDIESKFTEAALGNINLADYRNFAHGRHHWFAKRSHNSSIIALITPEDELLASKTLLLLPKAIPKLVLKTAYQSAAASIELLIKSFMLVESVGKKRSIDPGKPGVPDFGRKLYNLRYASLVKSSKRISNKNESNIILKKAKTSSTDNLSPEQLSYWTSAYKTYSNKLAKTKFGIIIFDYDGTLCRPQDRFNPLSQEIVRHLNTILRYGFVMGVVTGRGQSARKELQAAIDPKFWANVILGYYNGADIGTLENDNLPNTKVKADETLNKLNELLTSFDFPVKINIELRPKQLTIEINDKFEWKRIRGLILQIIMKSELSGFQLLESSHSMDIILRPEVSKLNILKQCINKANAKKISPNYLCIGDRGQWPGNDFELLSTPYSLSVDEVSSDKDSCWNFSPVGLEGVDSTLIYLSGIKPFKDHFRINI
ncbi:MAG: HAD hydrolase family protein [Bacteroidetes bacterium]|nr:HAD hydrolase family protein [Bacteroidota bacterium]